METNYNLKAFRQQFKARGVFYTDTALAEYLKSQFRQEIKEVYDPTCGNGGLLCVFDDNVCKFGQEIDADQLEVAKERLPNFSGFSGDTLKEPMWRGRKFQSIIANPPFSIKWEPFEDERFKDAPCLPPAGKADYAFILHCLHYLADDGQAVILEFPGILYRGQREGKIRQWLIEKNYIEKVIHIAGNKFADTAIATCCIVLSKSKTTTDIVFEDNEKGKARVVTFEEVKENGFVLSVSNYIIEEVKKEIVDPIALELDARKAFLKKFRAELKFSRMVCQFEGLDFNQFLDDICAVIEDERKEGDVL